MGLTKRNYTDNVTVITAKNLNDIQDAIIALEASSGDGLTEDIKQALLQIAQKVAYIDDQGATYYQDLYDALYPPKTAVSISAVFTQGSTVVYDNASLDSLKTMLVVTATYDDSSTEVLQSTAYTLSGTLTPGTSTVTVTYNSLTTTFTVTVTAAPTLSSITAVYTQSGTVYDTDTLDSLKADLVVTAHYSDSSTSTVDAADYTLSGTLTVGTPTITVSYGGKTDTFTVTVSYPTREMLFGTLRPNVALLKNNSGDTPSLAVYVVNPSSAASSRAIVAGPIPNRNFVITSKDTSKYQVLVVGITSDTKMTTSTPSAAIDGYWYQGDNTTIAWANSGSSNADFVWIGLKNKNGAALSASELANSGEAIFSYTMT